MHDLIRLVEVFGTHLLTLDVRQHSARHGQALEEILAWARVCPRYGKLSPNDRFDCLVHELQQTRPLIPTHLPFSPATCEVVQTFRTVAAVLEQQCAGGGGSLYHQRHHRVGPPAGSAAAGAGSPAVPAGRGRQPS